MPESVGAGMAGPEELKRWLEAQGLGACAQPLIDNEVDLALLPELTDKDLASIGLVLGLRRQLLKAAAALASAAATPIPAAAVAAGPPAAHALPIAAAAASPVVLDGERRHMVVMFCDLVDTTGAADKLDAEDRLDLFASFLKPVSEAVRRYGGHIAKTLGNGLMVYFGYPEAQENDAERALHAGLAVHEAITAQAIRFSADGVPPLAARVGLHSGLVVVADGADAFGDVPNIASRVQTATRPGQVMISGAVYRAVAGLFVVEDKGPHTLKGVPVPMTLFRVIHATSPRRRLRPTEGQTPLVGRDEQMRQIAACWSRAASGTGQLVVIGGDSGLGKTRLVDEMQARLAGTPHTLVEWSCAQLLQSGPLNPVIEWARYRFGGSAIPGQQRLADLEAALAAVKLDAARFLPVLAPLFDIPLPPGLPPFAGDPEETRRRQLAAVVDWILAATLEQPVLLIVEDAHWADPSTLELVHALAGRSQTARLLLVMTARPEFQAQWLASSPHTEIALAPLAASDIRQMMAALTAGEAGATLGDDLAGIVVRRTGGVPLFIEEVTRLLVQTQGRAGPRAIPSSLAASLTARLDRLGHGKKVAQIGAMLGREFGWRLLRAVSGLDDDVLKADLVRLVEDGLLQSQGVPPDATYRFKNALLQDAARDGLLRPQWRDLHRLAAKVLSEEFPDTVTAEPELLAHHLTEAGQAEAAVAAWETAADRAATRGAFTEAGAHVRRAIEVLVTLPEDPARATREARLRARLTESH